MKSSKEIAGRPSTLHGILARPHGIPRGFLRLYVLHRIAEKPAHGYDLLQEIEAKTEGVWRPGPGSIYPILKELVSKGFIRSEPAKKAKTQRVYHITPSGRRLLQQSTEGFSRAGKNWGAMRPIIIELVDPKSIPSMFTHMTSGQFAFLRGILETKKDKLPRSEIRFMLKEYALNLEKQLDWTKRMMKS
jgi:DNA-binding PadR family transcriptional regulator